MATTLQTVEHVSPRCVKLTYDAALRNNSALRDPSEYQINGSGITITRVDVEYSQRQPYVGGGVNGGAPVAVYLILSTNPYTAGSTAAGVDAATTIVDFTGAALGAPDTKTFTPVLYVEPSYWTADGVCTIDTFNELGKEGRSDFTTDQPLNYSTAHMIGKLADMMSGGMIGYLASAIDGPAEPEHITTFSPAGFASTPTSVPGLGSSFTFENAVIPCHIDKLWGNSDGSNRLFRTSISFRSHSCQVILAEGKSDMTEVGVLAADKWHAPNEGDDRQIVLETAPLEGATVLAVYTPQKSLLQIGSEILAYDESDIHAGTAVIYGRGQLSSDLIAHSIGDRVQDVWCASFVSRAEINSLAFGASGRALEYIAQDYGCPRSDNPFLNDTDLRRMIFHTSCTMRGITGTVQEGIRYIFPQLWKYMIVGEDPRWPGCVVIWFSSSTVIGDTSWITSPAIEVWEKWLDDFSPDDGLPLDLVAETFYRDDAVDAAVYGDFYLSDYTVTSSGWAFPVVLSGPEIFLIGLPSTTIPPAFNSGGVLNTQYKDLLTRPHALDKVLPIGCGVLLLDYDVL
jgi:hypothetical protein